MFVDYEVLENDIPHNTSLLKILCICASTLGLESAFNVLFSLSDPLMSKLHLSSNWTFAAWMSGPLAGLIVLPIIGYYSDICKWKLGRRRPFIIFGLIGASAGIGLLYVLKSFHEYMSQVSIGISMVSILFLTYGSINTMLGPSRALIGDVIASAQQELANSMASLMVGLSSILPNLVGGLGYFIKTSSYSEQADTITLIFCIVMMIFCVSVTLITAKEIPIQKISTNHASGPFRQLWVSLKTMPPAMTRASIILILSWIANYPFTMKCTDFFMEDVFADSNLGLCFGMLCIASANIFSFFYSMIHAWVIEKFGIKMIYSISHLIQGIALGMVFFVRNPWILFGVFTTIGMAITAYNSTPYAIVASSVQPDSMGIYMSVLSAFIDVAYIISNIILNFIIGNIFDKYYNSSWKVTKLQTMVGFGSLVSFITAFYSFFLIDPAINENSNQILSLTTESYTSSNV